MDAPFNSSTQSRERLSFISPSQVFAIGLVAVSIGWAVWLLRDQPIREETELLSGTVLPSSELAIMEAAFDRAQLTDHRTEGGRVYVPRNRQSAYMRALVDNEALPREFGGSLRRALANNSPWQSRAVQSELLRVATQEELSLVICSMPGIERAAVLYDVGERSSPDGAIRGGSVKTASVNVSTQLDSELDPLRVQAIRVLVASSIAGLSPDHVAVTDLRSGRVFVGPLEQESNIAATDPALAKKIAYEQYLTGKLRQSLSFVKGAVVDVAVEFESAESEVLQAIIDGVPEPAVPSRTDPVVVQQIAAANTPLEIAPVKTPPPPVTIQVAPPQRPTTEHALASIHVSIAVPESYFQTAFRADNQALTETNLRSSEALEGAMQIVADREINRIRQLVVQMIPMARNPENQQIIFTRFAVAQAAVSRRQAESSQSIRADRADALTHNASKPPALQRGEDLAQSTGHPAASLPVPLVQSLVNLLPEHLRSSDGQADVPREAWLAAASICVGLLAGFLWWAGSRPSSQSRLSVRYQSSHRRQSHPQIDWAGVDADLSDSDQRLEPRDAHQFKAAA